MQNSKYVSHSPIDEHLKRAEPRTVSFPPFRGIGPPTHLLGVGRGNLTSSHPTLLVKCVELVQNGNISSDEPQKNNQTRIFMICLILQLFVHSRRPRSLRESVVDPARIRCCHRHRLTNKTYSAIPEQRTKQQNVSRSKSPFYVSKIRAMKSTMGMMMVVIMTIVTRDWIEVT